MARAIEARRISSEGSTGNEPRDSRALSRLSVASAGSQTDYALWRLSLILADIATHTVQRESDDDKHEERKTAKRRNWRGDSSE